MSSVVWGTGAPANRGSKRKPSIFITSRVLMLGNWNAVWYAFATSARTFCQVTDPLKTSMEMCCKLTSLGSIWGRDLLFPSQLRDPSLEVNLRTRTWPAIEGFASKRTRNFLECLSAAASPLLCSRYLQPKQWRCTSLNTRGVASEWNKRERSRQVVRVWIMTASRSFLSLDTVSRTRPRTSGESLLTMLVVGRLLVMMVVNIRKGTRCSHHRRTGSPRHLCKIYVHVTQLN